MKGHPNAVHAAQQQLIHITSPESAYSIMAARKVVISAEESSADACFNMADFKGNNMPTRAQGMHLGGTGVCLLMKWDGPVDVTPEVWNSGLARNILFKDPGDRAVLDTALADRAKGTPPAAVLADNDVWRWMVGPGTDKHLTVERFQVDRNVVKEAWINNRLPRKFMGAWASLPRWVRSLYARHGVEKYINALRELNSPRGQQITVDHISNIK